MGTSKSLTGGQTAIGTSVDATDTDQFVVSGLDNSIESGAGNLSVNGSFGLDSATRVELTSGSSAVVDTVSLDGGSNIVAMAAGAVLADASIDVTVASGEANSGNNYVQLENAGGTTSVRLSGPGDTVVLNGDANNTVALAPDSAGGSSVVIGAVHDQEFGYASDVTLTGGNNKLFVGDEDATVIGSTDDLIFLGDGTNNVVVDGTGATIIAGGGNNRIDAGSGEAKVLLLGADDLLVPGSGPLAETPEDVIKLGGTDNTVFATYENLTIEGNFASDSLISLGNGNNTVTMSGQGNVVLVGTGTNSITFSGSNNDLSVQDPTGTGTESVFLGTSSGNAVSLDAAGGTVTGTDTSSSTLNTIAQVGSEHVSLDLASGAGLISLGDGSDEVTANGNKTSIALGNGVDTVTANGDATDVTVGSGNDSVTANGAGSEVSVGDGNDMIFAGGQGAFVKAGDGNDFIFAGGMRTTIIVGNGKDLVVANSDYASVTAGSGNATITAAGDHSSVTIAGKSATSDFVTIGGDATMRATAGTYQVTVADGDNVIFLNATNVGTALTVSGNGNHAVLGDDASAMVQLDPSAIGGVVTVQAASAGGTYAGVVSVTGFTGADLLDLEGLNGANGTALDSLGRVAANTTVGAGSLTIALLGGGSIHLDTSTLAGANLILGTQTGAV